MPDDAPRLTADDLNRALDKLRGKPPGTTAAAGGDVADVLKREEDEKLQAEMAAAEAQVESAPAPVPPLGEPAPVAPAPVEPPADDVPSAPPPGLGEYADEWQEVCDKFAGFIEGFIADNYEPMNPTQTAISIGKVVQGSSVNKIPGVLARAIRVSTHSDQREEAMRDCVFAAAWCLHLAFDCIMWRGQQNDPRGRRRVVEPKQTVPRNPDGTLNLSVGIKAEVAPVADVAAAPEAPAAQPATPSGPPSPLCARLLAKRATFPRNPDGTLDLAVKPHQVNAGGQRRVVVPKFTVPRDENGNVCIPVPPLPPPVRIDRPLGPKK